MNTKAIKLTKITCLALVAAALMAAPAITRAQDSTNAPTPMPAPKKHAPPFHGKVVSVDTAAMTFTVGTMTIGITSTTKISKGGKPAVFADITAGENVSGAYKKDEAGKLIATTVRIGTPKPAAPPAPAPEPAPAPAAK